MSNYKQAGKTALDGLQAIFNRPGPPLVTGPRVHNTVRYSRSAQDEAVYIAQLLMMRDVPHRTLVGHEVQEYVNEVLAMPWPRWREGDQWPIQVKLVPDLTAESGVAEIRSGVVYLPPSVSEVIVLHELAHHFAPVPSGWHGSRMPVPHGLSFVLAFLDLVEHVMNANAASVLRGWLTAEGISC